MGFPVPGNRFNPRPAARPGESRVTSPASSALACFNPRPAARPGESPQSGVHRVDFLVSIHARPLGRANPATSILRALPISAFQSTPGRSAGRILAQIERDFTAKVFQSTPGRSAGRIHAATEGIPWCVVFQSTPGRSAGRIGVHQFLELRAIGVSIHARPLGRANRWFFDPEGNAALVSIHARPLGRANPLSVRAAHLT
uniref:Uncharacterized protein n=1 Tax=mine drainage metagenome TaxID=410659 RepID=E6PG34_9ZZZZ